MFTAVQIASVVGQMLAGILVGWLLWRLGGRSRPAGRELQHLEGLRALAALAVVGCHTTQHIVARLGFEGSPDAGNRLGILGVQMFFGLTAFLFVRRILAGDLDIVDFMAGRIRRIVPLYLFLCVAALFVCALIYTPAVQPLSQTLQELGRYLAFGFVGGELPTVLGQNMAVWTGIAWTLPYEWEFYLMVPVLAVAVRSRGAVAAAGAIFLVAAAYDFTRLTETVWPFFASGIFAAFLEKHLPPPGPTLRLVLGALTLPLVAAALTLPGFFSAWQFVVTLLLFPVVVLSRPRLLATGALQWLGRISYSLYLMQYLVMTGLLLTGFRYPGMFAGGMLDGPGPVALTVVILVPLSYATWRLVERPWMRSPDRRPARPAASAADGARAIS